MPEVKARGGGAVEVRLDGEEAALMRSLIDEIGSLFEADVPRSDPVVERLFPDAYESRKEARAYRELVGEDLRAGKKEALKTVETKLGGTGGATMSLDPGELDAWLTVLTDLRLAIGTRLNVTQETMDEEPDPGDPNGAAKTVLHWLGWLQEMTLSELSLENE
ncbi:MAG TPA: DUF2017 family protein [Actinomycetota bacterium]|nr:DUF2017 family protein [Actinomycetota bacterium]